MKNNQGRREPSKTQKEIIRFMDAAMPAGLTGALSFHGIQHFPAYVMNTTINLLSSLEALFQHEPRGVFTSLKQSYAMAADNILSSQPAILISNNPESAAAIWASCCYVYVFYRLYNLQDKLPGQAALTRQMPPPLPRAEPVLPWPAQD